MSDRAGEAPLVAGAVLAAGGGRRMGRPKALVEVAGRPLVLSAVAVLQQAGCAPLAVVTGAAGDAVGSVLQQAGAAVAEVPNPRWDAGMAGSVHAALGWAGGTAADALVVLPVDVPGIGPAVVERLVAAWADGDRDHAAVATYSQRPRNPVLLPAAVWAEVAGALDGDRGARAWLRAHPDRVVEVDCTGLGDPADLDTPADLARWQEVRRH